MVDQKGDILNIDDIRLKYCTAAKHTILAVVKGHSIVDDYGSVDYLYKTQRHISTCCHLILKWIVQVL